MKRFFTWLIGVLLTAVVLVGATVAWFYYETDNREMPAPQVSAGDEELQMTRYDWYQPVLFGVAYKPFSHGAHPVRRVAAPGGALGLEVEEAQGLTARVDIQKNGKTLFTGTPEDLLAYRFPAAGEYLCTVTLTAEKKPGKGYGALQYGFTAVVSEAPVVELSAEKAAQGSVVALRVSGLLGEAPVSAQCELGTVNFTQKEGAYIAYLPIAYHREVGEYDIQVQAGSFFGTAVLQVVGGDFERVELPAELPASEGDAAQFRNKIWPLYDTAGEAPLWAGRFLQPVVGAVSAPYGAHCYRPGGGRSRHSGVDILAPAGTPVACPAGGTVVFAGSLGLTGNTVVVEHGLGLKTYYYYMQDLYVSPGDQVQAGQQLGTVGTTGLWNDEGGASHLHYEVKIGNQSIDPEPLERGEGGLFAY